MRQVWYLAHQVSGDIDANVESALLWLSYLRRAEPEVTVIAPWIAGLLSGEDDRDPISRERALVDCETVVATCYGLILAGPSVSAGMRRELQQMHGPVSRLAFAEPPIELVNPIAFGVREWVK